MESLDRLEEILLESTRVPFSSNRLVNEQEVIDILDSLRDSLPKEIIKAQKIVNKGMEYIEQSKVNAGNIINQAYNARNKLINTRGVKEESERQINEIIINSTQKARRTINEANRKAVNVEASMKTRLKELEQSYLYKNDRLKSEYFNLKNKLEIDFAQKTKMLNRKYELESNKLLEDINIRKNELIVIRNKISQESEIIRRDSIEYQNKIKNKCDGMIQQAKSESDMIKASANRYALDMLNEISSKIKDSLQNIESDRNELNSKYLNRDYANNQNIVSYKNRLKNAFNIKGNNQIDPKGKN